MAGGLKSRLQLGAGEPQEPARGPLGTPNDTAAGFFKARTGSCITQHNHGREVSHYRRISLAVTESHYEEETPQDTPAAADTGTVCLVLTTRDRGS